jgi:SPP1 gp7 family putative phage head morphogenesis protein
MANPDDWRPLPWNTTRYAAELDRWLRPLLLAAPAPAEQAIWETGEALVRRMVWNVAKANEQAWRATVARGTSAAQSQRLFAALRNEMKTSVGMRVRELVARNTKLIARLPDQLDTQTARYILRQQQRGIRSEALEPELARRLPQLRRSTVRMVARTQVARAETALTEARSEGLGIDWYEWVTSEDQRVRPSHRRMDKVLVAWADPPSPELLAGLPNSWGHYHPGGAAGCRCIALPLMELAEVRWPHKVYSHGVLTRMSRAEFEHFVALPHGLFRAKPSSPHSLIF